MQARDGNSWMGSACALLLALAAQVAVAAPDCARPYTLGLHEHGLLYSAETGSGIDKDIADELARRSGCRLQVTLMTRARIWQLIESGALDFSLSGISNPQRDKFASFAWYFSNKYYLLVRRDAQVQSLDDFLDQPRLKLGLIRGFRYGERANQFVDRLAGQQRVIQASAWPALFAALQDRQIQAMIIEPFDTPMLQASGLRELGLVLEFPDPPVPHGLIMSRASLSEAQQQEWRALIRQMRRDGSLQRIFEKYFRPELAQQMLEAAP
jgi:polar amino acid transport system substrate-binding protein